MAQYKSITPGQVESLMESAYNARDEIVPLLMGDPGIGKTEGVFAFAKKKGVKVVQFILSNTIPSEVSGIRMPDTSTKKLEVFDDSRMSSLEDGDILFFDEILEAPESLWSACLTLIQTRVMASGRPLPDIMICAASNPLPSATVMKGSVKDRFVFVQVKSDLDEWKAWFRSEFGTTPDIDGSWTWDDDPSSWNTWTPRKFVKLYKWYLACKTPEDKDIWAQVVIKSYGETVRDVIVRTATNKSPRQKIVETVLEFGVDIPEDIDTMDLNELFEQLKNHPLWDDISAALSGKEA